MSIKLDGKTHYPKFGNVVILAGGAGSGKGFIYSKLVGIEGKVLDVDKIKELAFASNIIASKFEKEYDSELCDLDLSNSRDVDKLHDFIEEQGYAKKQLYNFAISLLTTPANKLPNLIFDVTLKDVHKLRRICNSVKDMGYDYENINIIWVVTDVNKAIEQNTQRNRTVSNEIINETHFGVANTMKYLLVISDELRNHMDGDIWIVFNVEGVDSKLIKSDFGGEYLEDVNYFLIKKSGADVDLPDKVYKQIKDYCPPSTW